MIGALLELVGEFLLELGMEVLVELGLHAFAEPFRKEPNPFLALLAYALFGGFLGGASVWLLPQLLIAPGPGRLANLILTPVAVGLCMAALGAWRARRGQPVFRIDRFSYGFVFAWAIGMVRFLAAG